MFVVAIVTGGCTDDDLTMVQDPTLTDGQGDSQFQMVVDSYDINVEADHDSRKSEPSATPEPESAQEKEIHDFWLFQFDASGNRLAAPKYYKVTAEKSLTACTSEAFAYLTKGTPMTIYVVTNINDANWASGAGFETLDKVKEQGLKLYPIQAGKDSDGDGVADKFYIPMSGELSRVTVTNSSLVVVPVTRMFAKVKIQVGFSDPTMKVYYVDIQEIPWYCKVSPLEQGKDANGEPAAVAFPAGTQMISRAFSSSDAIVDEGGNKWLIIYMPENIRGEVQDADKMAKKNIPEKALCVLIRAKYDGADYYYTVYPGENITNNFNVRRNRVYRVSVDVQNIIDQHNPSSNCYIVKPGEKLSFEPYNRAEKGGDYDISTYLNPNDPNKRIAYTKIIWQTKDCIGDNEHNRLVYYEPNEQTPQNSKIIIEKVGKEGNALVGAYNSAGKIIWSWHIWVTDNEPDNISKAVTYSTYRWDKNGIYTNEPRVPGYAIMPCNLGALDFRAGTMSYYSLDKGTIFPNDQIRTFSMLYQWGRKDPFPPMIYSTGTEDANSELEYINKYTGDHYANDNSTIVNKTSDYYSRAPKDYLFYSVVGRDQSSPLNFSIANPTVYISGTNTSGSTAYFANGDWCGNYNSTGLWGGTKGSGGYTFKSESGYYNITAHIYDNYGEKSIFDPCPIGWRVPPGDLWLGFTKTGLNPTDFEKEVNYCEIESGIRPGMSMYVMDWKKGPTIYFPLQGTRVYNGKCMNTGLCGNYHNATCDDNDRVNILHLHRNMNVVSTNAKNQKLFMIFEIEHPQYYSKSTAGPIRCVRDKK